MPNAHGEIFKVGFLMQTERLAYAVLLDEHKKTYMPIVTTPIHKTFIERLRSCDDFSQFDIMTLGFFHFLHHFWKAHGMRVSQIAIEPDDRQEPYEGKLMSYIEVYQSNEIGSVVSHTELILPDATVISVMEDAPFVVFGTDEVPIVFPVDYSKASGGNIVASIRDDITKMERGENP